VAQQLMKVEEVGTLAQLHPEVVRRAIRRGELAAVRLGKRLRVTEASYEAWITRNTVDPESYS
jgi:excisionase family DNA binding protein